MKKNKFTLKDILKFVIPSILGILILMTPFKDENQNTIVLVSALSKITNNAISSILRIDYLILIIIIFSCFLALFNRKGQIIKIEQSPSLVWTIIRILGLIFSVMTIFKLGPEIIWSTSTGGLVLYDLLSGLVTIFLVAGIALPFLTDFGLLEFVGVFLSKIMRPFFKLPGRSAVDCMASWVGDGTIGVALTNKQYEQGYYTEKEASIISTTFSAVSITFCLVVLENVKLLNYFAQFYLAVGMAGIVCAIIVPRIYPLSRKKDTRLVENKDANSEFVPKGWKRSSWALKLAVEKAHTNFNLITYSKNALQTVMGLWIGVVPVIMAVGTLALIVSEHTPVFSILGSPFIPILELLQLPEAKLASETMVVGFADMVVPSILAGNIQSELTRFVIAGVSVTQLIYLSETGAVILGSKIPVNLGELFIIFIERTVISLPIIILFARLFIK